MADRLGMRFDYELSKGQWDNPPPGSYFIFEGVTVERDRVLALRPPPPAETTAEDIAKLPQGIDELKARPDITSEEVAKLQAQVAGLTENASEDIAKVRQEIVDLRARLPSGKPKGLKRGPKGFSDEELKLFQVKFYLMLRISPPFQLAWRSMSTTTPYGLLIGAKETACALRRRRKMGDED